MTLLCNVCWAPYPFGASSRAQVAWLLQLERGRDAVGGSIGGRPLYVMRLGQTLKSAQLLYTRFRCLVYGLRDKCWVIVWA